MREYFWNLAIWLDQGLNTFFAGDPDETVSSRAAKARKAGRLWGCVLCRVLDWFDRGHCDNAIEADEGERIG